MFTNTINSVSTTISDPGSYGPDPDMDPEP